MTSIKQVEANHKNALKSTGPKTLEGKAAVRLNALKHGLLSRQTLLPDEDESALTELAESLLAELQPVGVLEDLLVDSITKDLWRLRRLGRVEAEIFAAQEFRKTSKQASQEAESRVTVTHRMMVEDPDACIRKFEDEEKYQEALRIVRRTEDPQRKFDTIGSTFVEDASGANAFTKLSRYETALTRGLFRALHELQRLQAVRTGHPVLPPVAVDVSVSGISEEPV